MKASLYLSTTTALRVRSPGQKRQVEAKLKHGFWTRDGGGIEKDAGYTAAGKGMASSEGTAVCITKLKNNGSVSNSVCFSPGELEITLGFEEIYYLNFTSDSFSASQISRRVIQKSKVRKI